MKVYIVLQKDFGSDDTSVLGAFTTKKKAKARFSEYVKERVSELDGYYTKSEIEDTVSITDFKVDDPTDYSPF